MTFLLPLEFKQFSASLSFHFLLAKSIKMAQLEKKVQFNISMTLKKDHSFICLIFTCMYILFTNPFKQKRNVMDTSVKV